MDKPVADNKRTYCKGRGCVMVNNCLRFAGHWDFSLYDDYRYWVKEKECIEAQHKWQLPIHTKEGNMKFEDLQELIVQWGKDKGIVGYSTQKDQFTKVVEEVGEIAAGIARGDKERMKDAIGDTLVTLIMLSEIAEIDMLEALTDVYREISGRTGEMKDGIFVKDE